MLCAIKIMMKQMKFCAAHPHLDPYLTRSCFVGFCLGAEVLLRNLFSLHQGNRKQCHMSGVTTDSPCPFRSLLLPSFSKKEILKGPFPKPVPDFCASLVLSLPLIRLTCIFFHKRLLLSKLFGHGTAYPCPNNWFFWTA